MKPSKFTTNVFANYLGRMWALVSVYIFIPLYIKFIGIESYGVIAFFGTITGIIALADFGLTSTFSRELARSSQDEFEYKKSLFKTLGIVYGLLVLLIISIFLFNSRSIAVAWLHSETISIPSLSYSIQLMGLAGGLQLFASFFLGGLIGLEKQVFANLLQFCWSLLRSGGSIAVLSISPTLEAFLYWHLLSNFLYLLSTWYYLKKNLGSNRGRIDFKLVRPHYSFATRMMLISIISAMNLQIDKLLVSKFLDVKSLGIYTIGATLAQVPIVIANPISNAIFPRFTNYFSDRKIEKAWYVYSHIGFFVSILVVPVSITLAIFPSEIIYIWTQNAQLASANKEVCRWLIFGSMFQALQIMPFNLSIAFGYTRATLTLAILFLGMISLTSIQMIPTYKMEGAALAWFLTNITLTIPYILYTNQKILPTVSRYYVIRSISTVLLPSICILSLIRMFVSDNPLVLWPVVIIGVLLSVTISILLFFQTTPLNIIKRVKTLLSST